tara:strand:- start:3472 stop:3819 length:348 start_codon:yes stop_codon:yes gene_type:complete
MSGRRSRTKGKAWEREVAQLLRRFWVDARRGFQSRAGDDEADVEDTPFWVECKVGQRPNVFKAFDQAELASDGRPVLIAIKRNAPNSHQDPSCFMAMRIENFLDLLEAAVGEGGW